MRVTSQRHPLTAVTISSSRLSHFRLGLALRRGLGPLAALDWNFLPDCEICEVVWWLQTWTGTKWIFSRCMNCMNSVWRCEESRWMYQEAWSTSRKLRTKGSLKLNTLPLAILSTAFNYSYKGIWPHQVCCIVGGGQMGMAQNGYVEKMSHIIGYYWILIVLFFILFYGWMNNNSFHVSKHPDPGGTWRICSLWGPMGRMIISRMRLPFCILCWPKLATQMPNLHEKLFRKGQTLISYYQVGFQRLVVPEISHTLR